jgi:energy-coupling factor transporter ATP-binding protein EcfA2
MSGKVILLCGQAGSGKDTIASMIENMLPGQVARLALAAPLKEFARAVFLFNESQLWGSSQERNKVDPRGSDLTYWDQSRERLWNVGATFVREWARAAKRPAPGDAVIAWFESLSPFTMLEKGAFANRAFEFSPRRVLQTLGTDLGRTVFGPDVWANIALERARKNTEAVTVITDGRFANEVEIFERSGARIVRVIDTESEPIPIVQHASERGLIGISPGRFHAVINNKKSLGLAKLEVDVRDMIEGFGWIG